MTKPQPTQFIELGSPVRKRLENLAGRDKVESRGA